MFNTRGYLRTCILLLLVGLLAFSWAPAGASWPEPSPEDPEFSDNFERVGGLQLPADLPESRATIADHDISTTQLLEPRSWIAQETRLVPSHMPPLPDPDARSVQRTAAICMVTSTADSGPNTLRECLGNAVTGDEIRFDTEVFLPTDPETITLSADLPYIVGLPNLTIDASDAGVILDGIGIGEESWGLAIYYSNGAAIRGLQLRNFNVAIWVGMSDGCTIGGDRSIGAGPLGQGNLISGNAFGIDLETGATNIAIIGNLIGTDVSGAMADGNDYAGVLIGFGATQNVIGGARSSEACTGPCNLISGNYIGIQIQDADTDGNTIQGNYIGTDLSGNSANGNEVAGIVIALEASQNIIGGARSPGVCDGPCNLISGNLDLGVVIQDSGTTGNQVLGNFVGSNPSGDAALPNNHGVVIGQDATDTQVGGAGTGEGNLISGNTNLGIWIDSAGAIDNQVLGNLIGTDISGVTAVPNYHGILISESTGNQVGGAVAGAGNLISGNEFSGIDLGFQATPGNTIAGNKIGTDLAGTAALPNFLGISMYEAANNMIGGTEPGAGNLISSNTQEGVHIGTNSNLNSLLGNTIGTDVAGEVALPNGVYGVFIGFGASHNAIGGVDPGGGNLISGNGQAGVFIQNETSVGNHILGNRIGTNRTGSSSLPNYNGVTVVGALETFIGGADTSTPWVCDGPCNLISGNDFFGVSIQGVSAVATGQTSPVPTDRLVVADQGNQVLGNFIGTDLAGTSALPNAAGVDLSYEATGNLIGGNGLSGEGNLISGNQREAIVVRHALTTDNQILGNRIGTQANGESALPNEEYGIWIYASGNTVGGDEPGLGNLISGQALDLGYYGVMIGTETEAAANNNQVIGNLIGTNRAGTGAIPNGGGVAIAWGASGSVIRDNIISGNDRHGIYVYDAPQNEFSNNHIGVALDGVSPLTNYGIGIYLEFTPQNLVGSGNTIAYNAGGVGIQYPESVGNTITQNSIYANLFWQIAFADVPAPLAPAPQLTGWDGETVSGTACAGCQVEVFANLRPQPAGRTYLGTTTAVGDGTFSLTVGPGYIYLAATATDAEGTTSEFSSSLLVGTIFFVNLPLIVNAADPQY